MTQFRIEGAAVSDIGLKRKDNEDSYIAQDGLYLVADGMGGGIDGRAASAEMIQQIERLAASPIRTRPMIDECVQNAQDALLSMGERQGAMAGTTLTGLVLKDTSTTDADEDAWYVVNIGDSRTYHLQHGERGWDASSMVQVTRDHSRLQEVIDSGEMLPQEARRRVPRNIITQAVGSPDGVVADYFRAEIPGRFIVCSDGVYSELSPSQMTQIASENVSARQVAQDLVNAALDAGGHDNATAVVVDALLCPDGQQEPSDLGTTGGSLGTGEPSEAEGTEPAGADAGEPEWRSSILAGTEDIDTMNDSTLETLRTTVKAEEAGQEPAAGSGSGNE